MAASSETFFNWYEGCRRRGVKRFARNALAPIPSPVSAECYRDAGPRCDVTTSLFPHGGRGTFISGAGR